MKKLLLTAFILIGLVSSAYAQDKKSDLIKAETMCETLAEVAEMIMSNRQAGVSMSKVLAVLAPKGPTPTPLDIFDKESVLEAYSTPRYNSENIQKSTIADFRDQRHVDCLKWVNQLFIQ